MFKKNITINVLIYILFWIYDKMKALLILDS